jgi:ATP-dependent exoDNAse (exonuclease V) beta subunit
MSLNLLEHDSLHRRLALDANQSFIVQAPAGSGKTELLIQRFLTLLATVNKPEEILAITFTKKAANEMRERIVKALQEAQSASEPKAPHQKQTWLLGLKVLDQDKKWQWNLIQNPNQLRIQTIDSFCAYLTKQLPLLSHFGSQPEITDHPDFLYREAVHEVLKHLEEQMPWSNAISQLLLHLDNDWNKLSDLLINLLMKRDQWLPYLQLNTHETAIKKQLEQHLALVISNSLNAVCSLFPVDSINEMMSIARFCAAHLAQINAFSPLLACLDQTELPGIKTSDLNAWLGIANLLLTKQFSWRKRVDKDIGFIPLSHLTSAQEKNLHAEYRQRFTALIYTLSQNDALRLALTELFFLPKPHYEEKQWNLLQALLHVLKIVAAQLRLSFQQYGQIDYIENTQAALSVLGEQEHPTDLALALDYQIRHILVDEFQDTSFTQYQLIEKLTWGWEPEDGRTLFIVGDPMQSIYRFREAEVGLFIRMRQNGIGHVALTPLTLSINFRSTAPIVTWNNTHFQKIFPDFNEIATGAVTYTPSIAKTDNPESNASYVEIKGHRNASEQRQAEHIVSLIQNIKQNYPQEKIAILVRSRTHLTSIIPALKKAKINYKAIDIDPLSSRQSIQDLMSLTCALLHPSDRIAWLAVLRAPWCGLSLADLHSIAHHSRTHTLLRQLEDAAIRQNISLEGQQRLHIIVPLLKEKIANRERHTLRVWIESTWILLGGPACLQDQAELDDIHSFFDLLDQMSHHHPALNMQKLKEKLHALYAKAHDDETLQIMTIHTAKGLEFDTVILPHLERKSASDDKSLLLWMEQPLDNDKTALLLAPLHATGNDKDSIYEYIQRQQKIKIDYETDRLLYVAATRAIKRLYFFYSFEENEKGSARIASSSFLEKMWPLLEKNPHHTILSYEDHRDTAKEEKIQHKYIMRLSSSWKNPIHDSVISVASHQKKNGFALVDIKAKLIGTVIHRVLQKMGQLGITWWSHQNKNRQETYLKFHLQQLGMTACDLSSAMHLITKTLENVMHDARAQWILKPHTHAQSEFALTAIIHQQIQRLVIDRTFIDETGIRWIIDYKTATSSHLEKNAFLEKEQKKYTAKMHSYAQAFAAMESTPIRLGLYFTSFPAWMEWDLGE